MNEREPKIVTARDEAVTFTADGKTEIAGTASFDESMSNDEVREVMAAAYGTSPDQVSLGREEIRAVRSASVGFRKWNSSWEPAGPKGNPDLN